MKRLALSLVLTLAALPARAEDRLTLLLDWFVNPDHGPIVIAQQKGFFAEAGLAVEVIAPADPADPPKMVAAGKADLAVSYQPQLHLLHHAGLPLIRVGALIDTPLNCLLTRRDGPVRSPADLNGRKVGYSVGGIEEAVVARILASHGLAPDQVEMVNVNWSLSPALMAGQVDAVIGAFRNFELNQMALEGVPGRCFPVEEEGLPRYDELIYVANPETLDKDVIARFLAATGKAVQFIDAHPEQAWTVFAASAPELDTELNRRAWADTQALFARDPAALDPARYARYEAFLHEAGLIAAPAPVSELALDPGAE